MVNRIDKEELYQYYIVDNHSKEDTYAHFNISDSSFDKLLNHYNIHKFRLHQQCLDKEKELKENISYVKYLYLDLNKSQSQLAEILDCSVTFIGYFLMSNNIRKRNFKKYNLAKDIKSEEIK